MSVDQLKALCDQRFPLSITRSRIMENLDKLIGLIQSNGMKGEVWIDGSFLTEKLNPDDVDLVLVVKAPDYLSMDDKARKFFEWFQKTPLYDQYRCDNYALLMDENRPDNDWRLAYWIKQFGFSRTDVMKGLAVVKVPFVVTP